MGKTRKYMYTKNEMAHDIINLMKGDFSDFIKEEVLDNILWAVTEIRDYEFSKIVPKAKYRGCKYWSGEALKKAYGINSPTELTSSSKYKNNNDLRHEHVIPKAVIKSYILEYINNTILDSNELYNKILGVLNHSYGCVLTKEQASNVDKIYKDKMPSGKEDIFNPKNTWARYKILDDDIYNVSWDLKSSSWIILKAEKN